MGKWLDKIKSGKKENLLILLLFGILLLVIAIPVDSGSSAIQKETEPQMRVQETYQLSSYTRTWQLENRLQQILSQVAGIGKVQVMLTLKSEGKKIIEKDIEQSQGKEENQAEGTLTVSDQVSSSESTVYQRDSQGNENPYVTEELEPEIAGVLVIAQGAGNASVVAEITEAVMALFGVEAHKIKVMKME